MRGGKSRRMLLWKVITDFVHVRHKKEANRPVRFVSDPTRERVEDAKISDFRRKFLVLPVLGLGRAMKPLEMVLIDAVLHHLKKITMNDSSAHRARSVRSDKHVIARQKWRGIGTEISENYSRQLLHLVGGMTNSLSEGAVSRLARLFQHAPLDVVKPAVIAAAQAAIFEVTKLERCSTMRAAQREKTHPAAIVAKEHEVFAQDSSSQRFFLQFINKGNRMPIPSQHLAAWCSGTHSGQCLILFMT